MSRISDGEDGTAAVGSLIAAQTFLSAGRIADAMARCRDHLHAHPTDPAALRLLGLGLLAQGRRAEGIAMLAAVPALDAAGRDALAAALRAVGLGTEAEARADMPAPVTGARDPTRGQERLQAGNAHWFAGEVGLAEAAYRSAIAADPALAGAHANLGNALTAQGRLDEAFAAYRAALAREPENPEFGLAYALALLLAGDTEAGWRWYECRRRSAGLRWNYDRRRELPQWTEGMDIAGRHLLVTAEQGFGDMIQHARLAPLLAERGARVTLELPVVLHRLFAGMPGIGRLVDRDAPASGCDLAVPLLSLPRLLGLSLATIPPPWIAQRADLDAQWAAWLGPADGRRRIGLVVSGAAEHPHDARRSIPLARCAGLAAQTRQFVLVQQDVRPGDRAARDAWPHLRFPGAALTDFAETAALLRGLDLVIAVDTAVAHLAGSLGRPVWLLVAHAPDHRWMLGRRDSPWYPTMRLYRQAAPGDWDGVLAEVARDLAAF